MEKKNSPGPGNWIVNGRRFNKKHPDQPKNLPVEIQEQHSALGMRPRQTKTQEPGSVPAPYFGYPIDVMQAARFIHNAFTTTNKIFDKLANKSSSHDFTADESAFIQAAIGLTYGMTFDRTVLLKILSQSNCEGIRGYLCQREDAHVSLVLVGVDCDAYDLNYDIVPPTASFSPEANIETKSLSAEYGHPPGAKFKPELFDEHYILLNHAKKM